MLVVSRQSLSRQFKKNNSINCLSTNNHLSNRAARQALSSPTLNKFKQLHIVCSNAIIHFKNYSLPPEEFCKIKITCNKNNGKVNQTVFLKCGKNMMKVGSIIAHQYRQTIGNIYEAMPMRNVHTYG